MKNIFKLLILVLFASCSHMKSGQYVYWDGKISLDQIAKKNKMKVEDIKSANNPIKPGSWLFIPNQIGWARFLKDTTVIDDYSLLGKGEYAWPVPGIFKVSSGFGPRKGRNHDGIDIPGPEGTPIVSTADGIVRYANNKISGYGNMIIVEHSKDIFSVYAHNEENLVDVGDNVKRGQQIALLGNTGRSSGPHLHFEIRVKNQPRNPAGFLSKFP
jgi:murein DD-endopeptidase MepM/ murein hydrolase activator NlpD